MKQKLFLDVLLQGMVMSGWLATCSFDLPRSKTSLVTLLHPQIKCDYSQTCCSHSWHWCNYLFLKGMVMYHVTGYTLIGYRCSLVEWMPRHGWIKPKCCSRHYLPRSYDQEPVFIWHIRVGKLTKNHVSPVLIHIHYDRLGKMYHRSTLRLCEYRPRDACK